MQQQIDKMGYLPYNQGVVQVTPSSLMALDTALAP